jgi:nitrogen fixation protein NifU and related proteins
MNKYYTKETMERFLNPQHMGFMDDANGIGEVGNPRCGDQMKVYIKVEKGKIKKASFQTLGCVAAIATSDVICEMVIGKTLEEALEITEKEMIKRLKKLPSVKIHCSSLAIEGLKKAIDDYKK